MNGEATGFFGRDHIERALGYLAGAHQLLVTFLAILERKPGEGPLAAPRFVASTAETAILDRFFAVPGNPERPYYVPFQDGITRTNYDCWHMSKYAGSSLQRIRKDRQSIFHIDRTKPNRPYYGLPADLRQLVDNADDMIGPIPFSLHNLAVWLYRLDDVGDHGAAVERLLGDFMFAEAGLLGDLFTRDIDAHLGAIPLEPTPLSPQALLSTLRVVKPGAKPGGAPAIIVATTPDPRSPAPVEGPGWTGDAGPTLASKGLMGLHEPMTRAMAALAAGQHVILTGPPGTGKTTLAEALCEAAGRPYTTVTATTAWTTQETMGGMYPAPRGARHPLAFRAGILVRAMAEHRVLIIDEINRADIDKAFGEAFTLLSGKSVDLPYQVHDRMGRGHPVRLVPAGAPHAFGTVVMPAWWRIVATMNDQDRAGLRSLSYALVRRFAFVPVMPPAPPEFRAAIEASIAGRAFTPGYDVDRLASDLGDMFAEPEGLASFGMAMGVGFASAVVALVAGMSAAAPEWGYADVLAKAMGSALTPQFQGNHDKVADLVGLVERVLGGDAAELVRAEAMVVVGDV